MTFDHILFPTDFSEHSRALNKQVEWLAARFASQVTLLHVFEIPMAWYAAGEASFINLDCLNALSDSAKQRLNEYSINLPEAHLQRIIAEGEVAGHITNWTNEHDVDLIMMGTHGHGKLRGLLLGSVAAKVMHDVNCPVWADSMLDAHAGRQESGVSNIVCAIEMSDEAIPLLRFTRELATEFGAKVWAVHSVPEAETHPDSYFDIDLHQYLADSARVEISKVQRAAGTQFPLTISGGGISKCVSAAALEHQADLVVIGRGKAQETCGQLRTHAYQIIRDAPCPVLSYSLNQQDHISSSCNAERLSQSAGDGQLLIGSRMP